MTRRCREGRTHTHDKDLNMTKVDIFNIRTRTLHIYNGPVLERLENGKVYGRGDPWFFCQMLQGDSGDNIPGIPKYGPVNALKALKGMTDWDEMYEVVWGIYSEYCDDTYGPSDGHFIARARFLEIAQLLWMHVHGNTDIKTFMEARHEFKQL